MLESTGERATYLQALCIIVASVAIAGCNYNFSVSGNQQTTHGPAPKLPSAVIEAPPGTMASIGIKYFDQEGEKVAWASNSFVREIPESGKYEIEIEDAHQGYQIDAIVAAAVPVSLTLLSEDKELKAVNEQSGGELKILAGKTLKDSETVAQEIRPSAAQQASLQKMIDTILAGQLSGKIDVAASVLVDEPTVGVLSAAIAEKLGKQKESDLKHWERWKTKEGLIVNQGQLQFENGSADVSIYIGNARLNALHFESEQLGTDWFKAPSDTSEYRQRGEKLIRHMVDGEVQQAYSLLSVIYHEQIPLEKFEELSTELREIVKSKIQSLEVVSEEFFERKPDSETTPYQIIYQAKMADGTAERFRIPFEFITTKDSKFGALAGLFYLPAPEEAVANSASKAETADVPKEEPGPAQPMTKDAGVKQKGNELSWQDRQRANSLRLVEQLSDQNVEGFVEMLHPLARKFVDRDRLAANFKRIVATTGALEKTSWKLLSASGDDQALMLKGRLPFQNDAADVTVSYVDFEPIGVLITKDDFVADTFDSTTGTDELVERGNKYWKALFAGELDKAYQLFIPEGKEDLFPRDKYIEMMKKGGLSDGGGALKMHTGSIRFSTSPDHSGDLHIEVFQLVERNDNRYQPCRLRYLIDDTNEPLLASFDTGNFNQTFPANSFELQADFYRAISTGDANSVMKLMHPFDWESVDVPVFDAFCKRFAKVAGPFESIDESQFSGRALYDAGNQQIDAVGMVKFKNREIKCSTKHVYDLVEGFNFIGVDEPFDDWTANIQDDGSLQKRGETMLQELIAGDSQKALQMLPKSFYDEIESELENFKREQAEFIEKTGRLKKISFASSEYDDKAGQWRFYYDLEFEQDNGDGLIAFDFDAMSASIVSFNYNRDKAAEEEAAEEEDAEEEAAEEAAEDVTEDSTEEE